MTRSETHADGIVPVGALAADIVSGSRGDCWSILPDTTLARLMCLVQEGTWDNLLVVSASLDERECLQLLEWVARRAPNLSLGFLVGLPPELLAARLEQLAGEPETSSTGRRLVFEYTHTPFAQALNVPSLGLTPMQAAKEICKPADVVYLHGHSDGQCLGMAGGVALCQRDALAPVQPGRRVLPCFFGADCRFAASEFVRVATRDLRARILVSLTCFGHAWTDEGYSPETRVGAGLLANRSIEALVTGMGAMWVGHRDTLEIYYACVAGLPVGRVVNGVNASRLRRGFHADLFCFGDPRQRLPRVVLPGLASVDGDVVKIVRPAGYQGPCDLEVKLDTWTESEHVVTAQRGQPSSALLQTDGTVFVSLPAQAREVWLRRLPLAAARREHAGLLPELRVAGMFVRELRRLLADHQEIFDVVRSDLRRADAAITVATDLLARAPSLTLQEGQLVPSAESNRLSRTLSAMLLRLGRSLSQSALTTLPRPRMALSILRPYFACRRPHSAQHACSYCGSTLMEAELESADATSRRYQGECQLCGIVYEDNAVARWIELDIAGEEPKRLEIAIEVYNPYGIPVPTCGAVAFQSFGGRQSSSVLLSRAILEVGGSAKLRGELVLPADTPFGIHRLVARVVAGPHISHCRRDFHMQ